MTDGQSVLGGVHCVSWTDFCLFSIVKTGLIVLKAINPDDM